VLDGLGREYRLAYRPPCKIRTAYMWHIYVECVYIDTP
jgi:hypothetical protein